MPKTVISYHTFIFPFLWDVSNQRKRITRDQFTKCLHPGWHRDVLTQSDKSTSEFFSQYRYFNSAAQNAIYDGGTKNEIVHNYCFDLQNFDGSKGSAERDSQHKKDAENPAIFRIQKKVIKKTKVEISNSDKPTSATLYEPFEYIFTLKINGIRLKLYNSGIGMIVYELENYDYSELDDINKINDYGRRLYMPFVNDYGECKLCADAITVNYADKPFAQSVISGAKTSDGSNIVLPEFITKLLSHGNYSVTTQNATKTAFHIEPVIGDRMFVACIYQNKQLVDTVSVWNVQTGQYAFLEDALTKKPTDKDNCARMLYELIFVDGDGVTCINRKMLHDLLDDHIYARWIEYGTITGITEYSMVCATSGLSFLSGPFLTEYVEMIMLALAQRASLLVFERLLSDSALKKEDIRRIQERYILFQSQLLLQEVTPEQQGIELYEELLESLFIEKQSEQIENQVDALFALKNYKNDSTESLILLVLAVLGIAETVSTVSEWFAGGVKEWDWIHLATSLGLAVVAVVLFLWNKRRK